MPEDERNAELERMISEAREQGIWLTEFPPIPKKRFGWTVAAGSLAYLRKLKVKPSDFDGLTLSDYMSVTVPGWGDTREEAYRMAIEKLRESRIGKKYLKRKKSAGDRSGNRKKKPRRRKKRR